MALIRADDDAILRDKLDDDLLPLHDACNYMLRKVLLIPQQVAVLGTLAQLQHTQAVRDLAKARITPEKD